MSSNSGTRLSAELLGMLSLGPVDGRFSPSALARIASSRAIVDAALASGMQIYGATTGIGSQKDVNVAAGQLGGFK